MAETGKSLGGQQKAISNQVGSYDPKRENFQLTPEVKEKFTEKLRQDPQELCGPCRELSRPDRRSESAVQGWFLGWLSAVRDRTWGTCIHGSAQ